VETVPEPNLSRKEVLGNRHAELTKGKKKDEEKEWGGTGLTIRWKVEGHMSIPDQ
jgi:hypothetical protein